MDCIEDGSKTDWLEQARANFVAGNLDSAASFYEQVVVLEPDCAEAWHGLGLVAVEAGEFDAAFDFLAEAIKLRPSSAIYLSDLGELYRRTGEPLLARVYLARALEIEPDNLASLINLGCVSGEQGYFDEARELLERALVLGPERADVYYNLGVLEQRDGHDGKALSLLGMAVALNPENISAITAQGETYRRVERLVEAAHCFNRALRVAPENSMARAGLADILASGGDLDGAEALLEAAPEGSEPLPLLLGRARLFEVRLNDAEAIICYEAAIKLAPREVSAYRCLVAIYREQREFSKALDLLIQALSLDDKNCQLLLDLAGLCHRDLGYGDAATYFYRQVLNLRPKHVPTLIAAGTSLSECDRHDEARECFNKSLEIDPDNPEVWALFAIAEMRAGRYEEALRLNEKALTFNWQPAAVLVNMGNVYWRMGRLDVAVQHYEQSLALVPIQLSALANVASICFDMGLRQKAWRYFAKAAKLPMAGKTSEQFRLNRSFSHLSMGRMKEGWADYECRPMNIEKYYGLPQWKGEDLSGKTILVWQDQGVGDVVMFGTMFNDLVAQAGQVVIECAPKLIPLLRRSIPLAKIIPPSVGKGPHALALSGCDYQISQGSLGQWLRPTVSAFPRSKKGFLKVDSARQKFWQQHFEKTGKPLKVGICWRSKVQDGARAQFYSSLDAWGPVFSVAGVHFVNLQYDDCASELKVVKEDFDVDIEVCQVVDMFNDLDETAALISALDLVISAPTSVAMLAAGIGVPTWFMCNFGWLAFGTKQHKWFPGMRSFGKSWDEKWDVALDQVGIELRQLVSDRAC